MTDQYFQMTFVHRDGSYWHPALVGRRGSSVKAYRLGRPGKGSNRIDNTVFVEAGDEQRMRDLILQHGHLVRCKNKSRTANMFGFGNRTRSISKIVLDGKVIWDRKDN